MLIPGEAWWRVFAAFDPVARYPFSEYGVFNILLHVNRSTLNDVGYERKGTHTQRTRGADGQTALALTRVWHHASAEDRILGTLASRIAWVLMGKHKPTYDPAGKWRRFRHYADDSVDAGDYVVVSDALKVRLTGNKAQEKIYRHHSGFIGGLKEVPITRMRERRPEEVSSGSAYGFADCVDSASSCLWNAA